MERITSEGRPSVLVDRDEPHGVFVTTMIETKDNIGKCFALGDLNPSVVDQMVKTNVILCQDIISVLYTTLDDRKRKRRLKLAELEEEANSKLYY